MTPALVSDESLFIPASAPFPEIASRRRLWWGLLLIGCAVLLLPLLLVDMPPLLDYPNHLARAFVLADGGADPILSTMYGPRWGIIPNLATDLILPGLIQVVPVHVAGRLVIGLALLLPVVSGILYSRALFGRRTLWSLGSCLIAANGLFLLGFLNFQIAVGLAPGCAAAWLHYRERHPFAVAAFGAAAAGLLFFCHLTGLLFFALLIGAYELDQLTRQPRYRRLMSHAAHRAAALLPAAGVAIGLYLLSPFVNEATQMDWGSLNQRLVRSLPFVGYDSTLDIACNALLALMLASLVWRGHLHVPRSSAIALGLLAALTLLGPLGFKGTGYVHVRFAVMLAIMLFAGLQPIRLSRRHAGLLMASVIALFGVRQAETAVVWAAHAESLADLRRVTASIEPGARILTASVDTGEAAKGRSAHLQRQTLADGTRLDGHAAALLVIERRVFWPFLFANLAQQPLQLFEPYYSIGQRTANVPHLRQLSALAAKQPDSEGFPIAGKWECCYDYVLLVPAGARPDFSHPALEAVARSDYASLFRVRHPGNGPASPTSIAVDRPPSRPPT